MTLFRPNTAGKSYKWEVLVLLWMAYLLNQADRQVFNTVLPQIKESLELSDVAVGWIATIFNLFYAVMVPIGGWAGDRFSRKWVTTLSILFWSIATMFTGFAGGFLALVLFRSVATGGGEAFFGPANYSLVARYHTDTRATAMSIHQTAYYIGIIASGWVAGHIADTLGWEWAFTIFGAAGVIWAIVMMIRLKDGKSEEPQRPHAQEIKKPGFFEGFKAVFTTPTALMLTIGFSGLIFVITGYLTWMPTYLHENFGMNLAGAGFHSMFYTHLFAFFGVLIAGALSDKIGVANPSRRMMLQGAGLLFSVPFIYMMGNSDALWVIYIGCAGFGFGRAFFDANTYTVLYDVTPPRLHSSCSSVMIMTGFGVGALAPVVLGAIKGSLGLSFGFTCLAAIWVICGVMMLVISRTHYRKDYNTIKSTK